MLYSKTDTDYNELTVTIKQIKNCYFQTELLQRFS